MRLNTALAQATSVLALCLLQGAWAQNQEPVPDSAAAAAPARVDSPRASFPRRLEQVWDVVELMGQPQSSFAPQRAARVALRAQGGLLVDGGCNYFSGRFEHDAQGQFRVPKYSGTHGRCEAPPRSEALLNSALVMVNRYRWDDGLVLSSEAGDLVRLRPSANQDTQEIEQALARRAAPVSNAGAATTDCRPAKPSKSRQAKGRTRSQPVAACPPASRAPAAVRAATAGQGARGGKAVASAKGAKAGKPVARTAAAKPASRTAGKPAAKPAAQAKKRGH